MSSLPDRHEHKRPRGWQPEIAAPWWKEFSAALIFACIGLAVTLFAIVEGIPIGEYAFWTN